MGKCSPKDASDASALTCKEDSQDLLGPAPVAEAASGATAPTFKEKDSQDLHGPSPIAEASIWCLALTRKEDNQDLLGPPPGANR